MTRSQLIEAIIKEMERVWDDEFSGAPDEYEWLLEHYGITEDEDVEWSGILEYDLGEAGPDDLANTQWMRFVTSDEEVIPFLEQLLNKYRSNTSVFPESV